MLQEVREGSGLKAIYERAVSGEMGAGPDRAGLLAAFLRDKLIAFQQTTFEPGRPSLIISGMASSTIGWKELPYAKVPQHLDGRGVIIERLDWQGPEWLGPTYLVSGIATECDVMRGEETEIIGLYADPVVSAFGEGSLMVLPGTHSKHALIQNGAIIDFKTFMTGELYDVLGRHSLLRASVDLDRFPDEKDGAFVEGVDWGAKNGLAAALFRVRTRAVLNGAPRADNTGFLSGVLIGAELSHVLQFENRPILLASGRAVSHLYAAAMKALANNKITWRELPPAQVEHASMAAHGLFLRRMQERA